MGRCRDIGYGSVMGMGFVICMVGGFISGLGVRLS